MFKFYKASWMRHSQVKGLSASRAEVVLPMLLIFLSANAVFGLASITHFSFTSKPSAPS